MMTGIFHLRLGVELGERIRLAAIALHVKQSQVVRLAIARGLTELCLDEVSFTPGVPQAEKHATIED